MILRITATSSKGGSRDWLVLPAFAGQALAESKRLGVDISGFEVPESAGECLRVAIAGRPARSIIIASLGPYKSRTAEKVRRAGGRVATLLQRAKCVRATVVMDKIAEEFPTDGARSFSEGLELGAFRFDRHKSKGKKPPACRVDLSFARVTRSTSDQIRDAHTVAMATNAARAIAHEPANLINPSTLAARSRAVAKQYGLKCSVVDHRKMKKLKMGAILAVGVGSATPPRLIVLEYGGSRGGKPVVLIGKAITFDTGGYSLKDKNGIVGMKYDKCGGTAVLGAMQAVTRLKPKVPVVGIIVAAENMISSQAYRPNDIITAMSGKTIEIISTDAEGRLVLADALTYAQKYYKPRVMIDLATLTGGIIVTLGQLRAGLFCNNDALGDKLLAAGERTHERLWSLPLDDEYLDLIKGDDSDIRNSGGRQAQSVVAAMFLKQFVDSKIPWAHLDIAGVAAVDKNTHYCQKGATGFGVRLLCDYLGSL